MMAEKLRRRPMPTTEEQRQFTIDGEGQVIFAPAEMPDQKKLLETRKDWTRRIRWTSRLPSWTNIGISFTNALHRETQFNAPFLWCVICVATGCLIYFTSTTEIAFQSIMFGLALMLTLITWAKQRPALKAMLIYGACIVAGLWLGKVETLIQPTQMLGSEINTTVTAQVIRFEHLASGRKRLLLHVEETNGPKLKYLSGTLRLTYRGEANFEPGDYIKGRARLFPPSGPVKPGGFDFAYQAYFADLAATGILFGAPTKLIVTRPVSLSITLRIRIFIERSRQAVERRIKLSLDGANGDLASALVTGRKSAISDQTNEALRATGLAHILSISGLHMVLAAGSALFAVRFVLSLFPAFSMIYNARKIAAVAALLVATLYLGISGAGIATQRSYIMLAIILLAVMFDRQALTMRNLTVAALLVLMVHPHEILNAGFHMSFAATAALIAAYGAIRTQKHQTHFFSHWLESDRFALRITNAVMTFFGGLALTALIAGLATGIFSLYHFERFAPYGILANVVAMPIVTALIMPAALMAMLLSPFDLDFYAWKAMGLGIDYVVAVANHIAAFTPYEGAGAIPNSAIITGTLALLFLTTCRTRLAILAIFPLCLAIISVQNRTLPIGYVHERGNTVGVLTETGNLALNRNRVSTFITDQWQSSLRAKNLQNPLIKKNLKLDALISQTHMQSAAYRFNCNADVCLFGIENSIGIATVKNYESLLQFCTYLESERASQKTLPVIVYEKVQIPFNCEPFKNSISSAQQRAFQGSLAIYDAEPNHIKTSNSGSKDKQTVPVAYRLKHSFVTLERPWHRHRAFSRAARNIETY